MKKTAIFLVGFLLIAVLTACSQAEAPVIDDAPVAETPEEAATLDEVDETLIDEDDDIDLGELI